MRLFVAVAVSEEVKTALAEAQRLLQRRLPDADVRWQKLEQSHLTLRFLGEVKERDLPGCRLAVNEAARRSRPFELTTAGFGAFPTVARPSVLWLGVGGDTAELDRLQSQVSRRLEHLVDAAANESFRPHLTLGRVRRMTAGSRSEYATISASAPLPAVSWQIGSVQLMASELRTGGVRHSELLSAPLSLE